VVVIIDSTMKDSAREFYAVHGPELRLLTEEGRRAFVEERLGLVLEQSELTGMIGYIGDLIRGDAPPTSGRKKGGLYK